MIHVANKRTFHDEAHTGEAVYIGRTMPGIPGSPLGNPFKPSDGSFTARTACIERYRGWLLSQPQNGNAWHELRRLKSLARRGDLYLLCWCAPQSCHGDVVKTVIEAMEQTQ